MVANVMKFFKSAVIEYFAPLNYLRKKLSRYFWNILIWLDQGANTLIGGDPDETLSSRMGKHIQKNRCLLCKWICKILHMIDPNHCAKSIEADEGANEVIK